MQNIAYLNNAVACSKTHLSALESFNPNSSNDIWRWIPQGLPYDLIDARNDNISPLVNDGVAGYTNQQCFNALQSDVRSIPAFRNRLLQQNANNQLANVNILFSAYHY